MVRSCAPGTGRVTRRRWSWCVGAFMLAAAGCAAGAPSPAASPNTQGSTGAATTDAPSKQDLEAEIHRLINAHRADAGLPALEWREEIAEVARRHSEEMAQGGRPFGHQHFDQRTAEIQQILPLGQIAENVAYDSRSGQSLPDLVVQGWLSSSGHRRNIEGQFSLTGIGVGESPNGLRFFTQIFVQPR